MVIDPLLLHYRPGSYMKWKLKLLAFSWGVKQVCGIIFMGTMAILWRLISQNLLFLALNLQL